MQTSHSLFLAEGLQCNVQGVVILIPKLQQQSSTITGASYSNIGLKLEEWRADLACLITFVTRGAISLVASCVCQVVDALLAI